MKKLAKWLAAAFILWWIVTSPSGAGLAVHHLGSGATRAANSLSRFISSI